jgi:hypothetical protein
LSLSMSLTSSSISSNAAALSSTSRRTPGSTRTQNGPAWPVWFAGGVA